MTDLKKLKQAADILEPLIDKYFAQCKENEIGPAISVQNLFNAGTSGAFLTMRQVNPDEDELLELFTKQFVWNFNKSMKIYHEVMEEKKGAKKND